MLLFSIVLALGTAVGFSFRRPAPNERPEERVQKIQESNERALAGLERLGQELLDPTRKKKRRLVQRQLREIHETMRFNSAQLKTLSRQLGDTHKAQQQLQREQAQLKELRSQLEQTREAHRRSERQADRAVEKLAEMEKLRVQLAEANAKINDLMISAEQNQRLVAVLREQAQQVQQAPPPEPEPAPGPAPVFAQQPVGEASPSQEAFIPSDEPVS